MAKRPGLLDARWLLINPYSGHKCLNLGFKNSFSSAQSKISVLRALFSDLGSLFSNYRIMAIYKAKPVGINAPAEAVYGKLSNLSNIKSLLANIPQSAIPDDKREMFDAVEITEDSIVFPAGPVGTITMKVTQKLEPTLIRLEGIGTPVALSLELQIGIISDSQCEASTVIDIAIPPMLKPMIGGTMQKMADQFTQVIGALKYE